jgi:hypothetical protein
MYDGFNPFLGPEAIELSRDIGRAPLGVYRSRTGAGDTPMRIVLALIAAAAAAAGPASAQQNPFVGTWTGGAGAIAFNLVMGADMSYSEQEIAGAIMTLQTGKYVLSAPDIVIFQVLDWQPKTMPVYHPTGTTGGYYTQEPTSKPPGGSYRYQFVNPNSFAVQDVTLGGAMTFTRK